MFKIRCIHCGKKILTETFASKTQGMCNSCYQQKLKKELSAECGIVPNIQPHELRGHNT